VQRLASFATSAGLALLLTVLVVVSSATDSFGRRLDEDDSDGGISSYVDDPLIDKPYRQADNWYWIFVHIIVIGYMLLGLNTVCDAYFTGALDTMVDRWDIKPDVAGATFMAAGGSAPELFTSLIGTTISESDVGFGTIVGSAVFNVLFVIGLCGAAAVNPIKLSWWPLARDCSCYIVGLSVLAIFAKTGNEIQLWEAIVLFLGYVGYCLLMSYNQQLEAWFNVTPPQEELSSPSSEAGATKLTQVMPVGDTGSVGMEATATESLGLGKIARSEKSDGSVFNEEKRRHGHIKKSQPHFARANSLGLPSHEQRALALEHPGVVSGPPVLVLGWRTSPNGTDSANTGGTRSSGTEAHSPHKEMSVATATVPEEEDEDDDDIEALVTPPQGRIALVIWLMSLPIYAPLYYLTPKPNERYFIATFLLSLLWIAGFSTFLVYSVEILGEVLRIHIIVMGFTLLAAGTSIPDAVSSVAVARAGQGDMAVSSSIGSNIFDILVGLPIPWIIKIGIIEMAANGRNYFAVKITSDYILLYVLILVFMVFCVILSIHFLGWVLSRRLGAGMGLLYAIFLITVLTVEFEQPDALKF